jgi:hypothetical protein
MANAEITLTKATSRRYREYYIGINEITGVKVVAVLDAGSIHYMVFRKKGEAWIRRTMRYCGDQTRCLEDATAALNE